METRPTRIHDDQLRVTLRDGWGFDATEMAYVALGFGSHHWTVTDPSGARRFVTVDELGGSTRSPPEAFAEIASAFGTARVLADGGLQFVVAPMPAVDGSVVRLLDTRFSVAVFPYVHGRAGSFGDEMADADRVALVERLAVLHDSTDQVRRIARLRGTEPITRAIAVIADALAETDHPWSGGPFSEPARQWLLERQREVRALLLQAARLIEQTAPPPASLAVTHGEPHPGNVIATERGLVLIDWDTVGLAPPERDLWMFADDERLLAHYTHITGTAVNPGGLALYDAAWTLSDLSVYLEQFRSVHDANEDTSHAWRVLESLRWVTRP